MQKKVLIVDDSALMRRVFCDIIHKDSKYCIEDEATNGLEALQLIREKDYDVVILDVNMPRMNGIELLKALKEEKKSPRVMMASLYTREGARVTMEALECGALDFIHIDADASTIRTEGFAKKFLDVLDAVASGTPRQMKETVIISDDVLKRHGGNENKIIAIATSTGGPQALRSLLQRLPSDVNAPIVIVQHMPPGFTRTLAERLNSVCRMTVREARQDELLEKGIAYIAQGGKHLKVKRIGRGYVLDLSDEPARENVKPCANYLFESLMEIGFDEVICIVLTGMGSDGTQGICNLCETEKVKVLAQSADTCVVYGMPKSIVKANIECEVLDLEDIADAIITSVGVK